MKRLKKLSLKKEIDREAESIEKEVKSRTDLEDLKVSEDMETSLFNKIQEYEYDKRYKTVHRRKKKRYVVLALAAVLVLVFGSVMTGVGSKSYWKVLWDRIAGNEHVSVINVENMETQETEDIDELQLFKRIREELGISTVRFGYIPTNMYLKEYEMDYEQQRAILLYDYNEYTVRYDMYINNTDSSFAQTELDELIDEYDITTYNDIIISVKEYDIEDMEQNRFVAEFEYQDAQYQLMGIIDKSEFDRILENLYFSR